MNLWEQTHGLQMLPRYWYLFLVFFRKQRRWRERRSVRKKFSAHLNVNNIHEEYGGGKYLTGNKSYFMIFNDWKFFWEFRCLFSNVVRLRSRLSFSSPGKFIDAVASLRDTLGIPWPQWTLHICNQHGVKLKSAQSPCKAQREVSEIREYL